MTKENNSTMKVPYFQVPNIIFDGDLNLSLHELAIYVYLCRCSNQNSRAFPSLPTIAKKTGMGRAKAAATIKTLIGKGYIKKTPRPGKSNIYGVVYVEDRSNLPGGLVPVHEVDPKKNFLKKNHIKESDQPPPTINSKKPKAEVQECISLYTELFEKKYDTKPRIDGNDWKVLEEIIVERGMDDTKKYLKTYFRMEDNFYKKNGYPIRLFRSQLNSIIAESKSSAECRMMILR